MLFQSENANDVIFVGYDTKGTRRYAALRSMTTDYKGEATGSDKHFSFALVADDRPVREVHVFEAAIDAMSYASLKIMYHKDWRKIAYLSLAGVFASKRANVVPVALEQFLKDHPQIMKVVLHLDNDRVGRQEAESIMGGLDIRHNAGEADDRPVREVHVFEAAIDAMSYASLKIMYHKDWRKIAYLSLAGVFASKRANVVPVALEQFLKDHSQITKVVLHLDNDRVGRQAAESIMGGLDKKYTILNRPPRAGKDVNDYLRMEIVNRNGKERER